jgi:2-desacetyl-2-hydroxyethyl bacteriochlorophyllide A dehydrogenase
VSQGATRQALFFTAPGKVEVRPEPAPTPGDGEVLVRTVVSAISAGTELLIYLGQAPAGMPADSALPSLAGTLAFPLKYGYACVGRILQVGAGVDRSLENRAVFAFQPHQSVFTAPAAETILLPPDMPLERALFLPGAETAVNLVQDGRPLAGERVVIFGQGVVGLLTTALLASMPLALLVTLDRFPQRRQASLRLGATASLDPNDEGAQERLAARLADAEHPGADLTFELSGDPAVLNQALRITGFDGRVVIGSWYGEKRAALDLGGEFHRSRIHLISSQVSTLAPRLRGRWSKSRRLHFALNFLDDVEPEGLISHRVPFAEAASAYQLLAEHPEQALQVVLTYSPSE